MENHSAHLTAVFHALVDPTRRAVLARLGKGPASVTELAAPFDMALPSFLKHIRLLEESGWIRTQKDGRVRTCALETKQFATMDAWLSQQRAICEARALRPDRVVAHKTRVRT